MHLNKIRLITNRAADNSENTSTLEGHRPVNVKRAVIGSKGGWKLSTIFLSCKVFHDWSIIKLGNILYLLDRSTLLYFLEQHLIAFVDLV